MESPKKVDTSDETVDVNNLNMLSDISDSTDSTDNLNNTTLDNYKLINNPLPNSHELGSSTALDNAV